MKPNGDDDQLRVWRAMFFACLIGAAIICAIVVAIKFLW